MTKIKKNIKKKVKKNVRYVIELCICSSYLNLKRYWLDDKYDRDIPSYLWIGSYVDAKTCIEKAKTDFKNHFDKEEYQMTVECHCWKNIPIFMRNIDEEELEYAE